MRPRIQWTPEDDDELRRVYSISSASRAAVALEKLATAKHISRRRCWERACLMGLSRADGRGRRWTQAEDENLRAYAGRLTVRRIARVLGRTDYSVIARMDHLELSARVRDRGYTRGELSDRMGLDRDGLRKLLENWPMTTNLIGNFANADVQLWIFEHLEELELRRMDQSWLKRILKEAAA